MLLPVLGVEYFWKINTRCTSSTRSFWGFDTASIYREYYECFGPLYFRIPPTGQYFGFRCCLWLLPVLEYLGVRYSWILPVLELFRGLFLVILLCVLAASKLSEIALYNRSISYTSTVSAPVRHFPSRLFGRKKSQTVPRVLLVANYFRGEQLEYLRAPAVFRESMLRVLAVFRGSLLRILSTPSISGFDTADTPVLAVLLLLILAVLLLLILPVLAVFRPSVLLILPLLAVRNVLDTPSILEVRSILGASVQHFEYHKDPKYFGCLHWCC